MRVYRSFSVFSRARFCLETRITCWRQQRALSSARNGSTMTTSLLSNLLQRYKDYPISPEPKSRVVEKPQQPKPPKKLHRVRSRPSEMKRADSPQSEWFIRACDKMRDLNVQCMLLQQRIDFVENEIAGLKKTRAFLMEKRGMKRGYPEVEEITRKLVAMDNRIVQIKKHIFDVIFKEMGDVLAVSSARVKRSEHIEYIYELLSILAKARPLTSFHYARIISALVRVGMVDSAINQYVELADAHENALDLSRRRAPDSEEDFEYMINATKPTSEMVEAIMLGYKNLGEGYSKEALEFYTKWKQIAPPTTSTEVFLAEVQLKDGKLLDCLQRLSRVSEGNINPKFMYSIGKSISKIKWDPEILKKIHSMIDQYVFPRSCGDGLSWFLISLDLVSHLDLALKTIDLISEKNVKVNPISAQNLLKLLQLKALSDPAFAKAVLHLKMLLLRNSRIQADSLRLNSGSQKSITSKISREKRKKEWASVSTAKLPS